MNIMHPHPARVRNVSRHIRVAVLLSMFAPAAPAADPATFVNPFVGTAGGGNTFPGAVRPWGMVSVSPHTNLSAPSGYTHGEPWFYGMGHVHLSGTGCADLGSIIVTATRGTVFTTAEAYRTRLGAESAEPGYYSAALPALHLTVRAAATERTGVIQFRTDADGDLLLLLDAGRSLALTGGGSVRFLNPTTLEGYNTSGGFCGESNRQTVFFSARITRTPSKHGVWSDTAVSTDTSATTNGKPVGAWLRVSLRKGERIEIRTGISYVSVQNARQNLETELADLPFDTVRTHARRAWNTALERVRPRGGSQDLRIKLFTSLYHALLHPNVISDVNGEFPGMRRKEIGRYEGRIRYTVFSLWDTYRTLHPLLTLLFPEQQSAMVKTMLDMYRESGSLPKWELAGNETFMMVGDPAVPVIADSYLKGICVADSTTIFSAIRAGTTPAADSIRPGYRDLLQMGYIPADQDTSQTWWVWGPVSSMLEYCLADWTIARIAGSRGLTDEEHEFDRRSRLYASVFDRNTRFLRPRLRNGAWMTPFDPLATEGSGSWTGSGGPGYVEGNAWHYTWFVPHDVHGIVTLLGGPEQCAAKLDSCFHMRHFTINNEPDIAYPYFFTYLPGRESRTREIVHDICKNEFGTGTDGLPGNDDAGTISAWFVFSALGFYPACPGSNEYRLGYPLFEQIDLVLPGPNSTPRTIAIRREGQARARADLIPAYWNRVPLRSHGLKHQDLIQGGLLSFAPSVPR